MCPAAHLLQVYKFNVPTFGPGVVFDVNWKIRSEQIRFFAESLRSERLKGYVPQFIMEIEVAPHPFACKGVPRRWLVHTTLANQMPTQTTALLLPCHRALSGVHSNR